MTTLGDSRNSTVRQSPPAPGRPLHRRRLVAWDAGADTAFALFSLLGMWAGYFGTSATDTPWPLYAAALLFGTALPAYVVFHRLGGTWADLGITRHRLVVALIVSVILGAGSMMQALKLANEHGVDPATHLLGNVFVFWEPFFYFGWLYLRWEKAFGGLAAPVLTGVSFTVMHLGAVPVAQAVGFGGFAVFFGALFAITRNLATLWPLAYPVTSAIGTLQAGIAFDRTVAMQGAVVMLVQFAVLAVLRRTAARHRRSGVAG